MRQTGATIPVSGELHDYSMVADRQRVALHPAMTICTSSAPPELPAGIWPLWYVALAFSHARVFGMLLILGLLVDSLLHRLGIFG